MSSPGQLLIGIGCEDGIAVHGFALSLIPAVIQASHAHQPAIPKIDVVWLFPRACLHTQIKLNRPRLQEAGRDTIRLIMFNNAYVQSGVLLPE